MYEELRSLPLLSVLSTFGFNEWKTRKGGTEWFGMCPVHKAKTNKTSFSFDVSGKFHCFSCNISGKGAIDLVKAIQGCGFNDAITFLSRDSLKQVLKPEQPQEIPLVEKSENAPYKASYEKYSVKSEWLDNRVCPEISAKFGVFCYNNPARRSIYSNKIMLPIRRFSDGELVGYLARSIQGEPKYLWPKGVAKSLEVFGSYELRSELQRRVQGGLAKLKVGFLVESPFCVMKFAQFGFPAVSCYGWSCSPQQIQILAQLFRGVVYLPDLDKRTEAMKQVAQLSGLMFVKFPEFSVPDPEQLSAQEIQALT